MRRTIAELGRIPQLAGAGLQQYGVTHVAILRMTISPEEDSDMQSPNTGLSKGYAYA
jgi:hypothetical protein